MNRFIACFFVCVCAAAATFVVGAEASRPASPDLVERALARIKAAPAPVPDLVDRLLQRQRLTATRPDDRAGVRGVALFESSSVIGASSVVASDFHWRDAGIGAATVVALMLAATTGLVVVRRYRAVVH